MIRSYLRRASLTELMSLALAGAIWATAALWFSGWM